MRPNRRQTAEITFTYALLVMIFWAFVGGFAWPYTINTWLIFFGKVPQIVWWHGMILGFIPGIGKFTVMLAALTWIAMMFLV